jgi:CBS domain-containing protein/uncharacterized protein (DUF2267 family)
MSLERFRRTRMVILPKRAPAYQAARAMEDNHIGAILITEPPGLAGIVTDRDLALVMLAGELAPKTTPLREIMSEDVIACEIDQGLSQVVRIMIEHGVRRVPVVERGKPVGLITFDDLVLEDAVPIEDLRAIVRAQLEVGAAHKPAGRLRPEGPARAERRPAGRAHALMRANARAQASYDRLMRMVVERAQGLDRPRCERALLLGLCMLCRRLTPGEASHLIAQLPSKLWRELDKCTDGPDRTVTRETMRAEIAHTLGIEADRAGSVMAAVFDAVAEVAAPGQMAEVRGQLPEDLKPLFTADA